MKHCLQRLGDVLPSVTPRLVVSSDQETAPSPARMHLGATGCGPLSTSERPCPILSNAVADEKLHALAATANRIYIWDLSAPVATVSQPIDELWRRRVVPFVDNEAACAAATKGASRSEVAVILPPTLWGTAVQYYIDIWTERVPT